MTRPATRIFLFVLCGLSFLGGWVTLDLALRDIPDFVFGTHWIPPLVVACDFAAGMWCFWVAIEGGV